MNNLAKASVSRLLRQGLTKISPYPSEFTLSFVEDYCSEWDFKTDMAAQLATDFNQRPGFRNKASSDMLHDELVCSILPSSDIDRCEYFHGQTHLKMKDKFWISMLEKHSSLMENREHFDGNLDILVDLRGPSTSWWTSYRTNLYLEAIEATLTAKVSSMNAIFEKVNNLTMEQCRNILDDQGVQKVVEELLKTRSLIQNQTQQPEFQPLALLKAKILLSFMISDHPHSCRYHLLVDEGASDVAYYLETILTSKLVRIIRPAHCSIGASTRERTYASIENLRLHNISQSSLRFNLLHRVPLTQPFCQSLEDLSTTSPLELYKSQIAERICTNPARSEENLLIGKSYLKAFEEVGSNLLEGRPNIKVYSRFFELMEIKLARDGLSVKSPTLESSIKKFITEVL